MSTKVEPEDTDIGARILHTLSIYPVISPTMMQSALGPSVKPSVWRPVLDDLIASEKVVQEHENKQTPAGRHNQYTKLSLPGTEINVAAQ